MATSTLDDKKLKNLLKSAVIEALDERRDLMREVIEEVMEDIGMARAIERGKTGKRVSKAEVIGILRQKKVRPL